jgi:hypothetical protein
MDHVIFPWPPVVRGALELAQGNIDRGLKLVLEAGNRLERNGVTYPSFIPWRAVAAPALVADGRVDEARDVILPAVQRATEFGSPWALGMALRVAGTVEQGAYGIELLHKLSERDGPPRRWVALPGRRGRRVRGSLPRWWPGRCRQFRRGRQARSGRSWAASGCRRT